MDIYFNEISSTDIAFKNIKAISQKFVNIDSYNFLKSGRPDDGLCMYTKGSAQYKISDPASGEFRYMEAYAGDLVYLPKGGRYRVEFFGGDDCTFDYLINFEAYDVTGCPINFLNSCDIIVSQAPAALQRLFKEASDTFSTRVGNTQNILKSYLFKILDEISPVLSKNAAAGITNDNKELFEKKLLFNLAEYIRNHATDNFTVGELAKRASISERYLRNLFNKYMGTSPVKYKNEVLIEYAKGLLTNGVMNVNEVAEFLGYYDAAYFSKVFKSTVGISPGKYIKLNNKSAYSVDLIF